MPRLVDLDTLSKIVQYKTLNDDRPAMSSEHPGDTLPVFDENGIKTGETINPMDVLSTDEDEPEELNIAIDKWLFGHSLWSEGLSYSRRTPDFHEQIDGYLETASEMLFKASLLLERVVED